MSGRKSYDELKFDLYYANEQIKEMRKELINNDEYIGKLQKEYDKEIERLNNIINELEKYINEEYIYDELGMKIFDASKLQDKLQELKGSE